MYALINGVVTGVMIHIILSGQIVIMKMHKIIMNTLQQIYV